MQERIKFVKTGPHGSVLAISLACLLATAGMQAQAQAVKPPPLPPGSSMVRVQGGMDENEVKREKRAHHHKGHVKKDHTRDDSVASNSGNQSGIPANNAGGKP